MEYMEDVKLRDNVRVQNIVASVSLHVEIPLEKVSSEIKNTEYDPEQFPGLVFRKLYADTYYDEGVNASKSGDRKEEKLLYLRSFMMYPLNPKPLRALLLALMGRHR